MKIKIDVNLTDNGGFFEFSDDVYIDNDSRVISQFYPTDSMDKRIFDQNLCYNGSFYSFFADGMNYPSLVWNRWDTYCDVEGEKCCPVSQTIDLRFNDLSKIKVFDCLYIDGHIDHCSSQIYYPGYPDKVSDYRYCFTYAEANEFINSFVDSWCQRYNCCDINYDSKIDYLDNPEEDYYHYLAEVRVNHLWYKVTSTQNYNHITLTSTNNKCLGFYNYDDFRKIKVYPVLDSGINLSDSDYYLILNFYDYDDLGLGSVFCADDFGAMHVKASFRQILCLLRIRDNKLYLVQANHIDGSNWLDYAFLVNNINHINNNITNIDIIDYFYKGVIREHREHELNCFGKCFNFELVEVSSIVACTDECLLGLIDAINNFRASLDDSVGECNVNLSDIAEAIRNYQFIISFPKSYDINVKEIPCIDFCNGASVGVDGSLGIASVPTVIPIAVSQFPTDWLGGLIAAIGSIVATLLAKDMTVENNITVPPSAVTVQPSSATVQNSITVPPSAVTVEPCSPTIQNIVNVPNSIDINSMPCIDFCNGASIGINTMPNLRISSMPTIGIDEIPDDLWDELLEKMDDLFVTCENQTIGDILANAFLYSCSDSVFKPLLQVDGRSFWDLLHDCFYSCDTVSLGTMFSQAFNLSNCLGSVFKANDNIWNREDSLAGILYKQLDYDFVLSSYRGSAINKSAFYAEVYSGGVAKIFNLCNLFFQSCFDGPEPTHSYSSFNFTNNISFTDLFNRSFFADTVDTSNPTKKYSVFNFGIGSGNDSNKILNHACTVNPNSIKFCEDVPLTMPTPEVNVTNEVVPASVSVTNNVPTPSVTVNNNVPEPEITIENNPNNVINVSPAENIPPNVFVNADGKSFLTEVPFK